MTRGQKLWLMAVPMMLVPVLGGCGAAEDRPRVASAGRDGSAPASAPPADDTQKAREFVKCMRAAGIELPDPRSDGMIAVPAQAAGSEGSPGAKKMDAAMEKCRDLLPAGGEPPKLSAEDLTKARDLSRCMRENGVPEFPDPDPETGAFAMTEDLGDNSKLGKATEKCRGVGPDALPGITAVK
ncbi:hypothetical protein [Actinoplanes friuliensis]|jgi:hypothetical protein|uniref:Secreted protein n=1 Tax=Actinoplanes friuliensis DSM 7358 TaxID=1246995 RepID=U5VXY4_9ACTN|nr:hypothetical protein [Actinoplanes friuliensis]AGZ41744.1 hypothetical protein AFR_17330 [Actinoplanes friuliensis DSM 7358]